jgi:hypothetical protein
MQMCLVAILYEIETFKKTYIKYAASFGVKSTFWQSNGITLTTFIETRKVASLAWSFGGGIGIGYAWED